MPNYLFIYTIDGEEKFIQHQTKNKLSPSRKTKHARKAFFDEYNIKIKTKEIVEDLMELSEVTMQEKI